MWNILWNNDKLSEHMPINVLTCGKTNIFLNGGSRWRGGIMTIPSIMKIDIDSNEPTLYL